MDRNVQEAAREIIADLDKLKAKIANYAGVENTTTTGGANLGTVADREELLLLLGQHDADQNVIDQIRRNRTLSVTEIWQNATYDQQSWWLEEVCEVENIPGTSREILAKWPNMPKPR